MCFEYMSRFFVGVLHCQGSPSMLILFITYAPTSCCTVEMPLFSRTLIKQTVQNASLSFSDLCMTIIVPAPTKKEALRMKEKSCNIFKEFMQSKYFSKFELGCFDPTQIFGAPDAYFGRAFNLFAGLPMTRMHIHDVCRAYQVPPDYPIESHPAIQAILQHIRVTLCDKQDDIYEYVLDWLAYILQHPGRKTQVMIVFVGPSGCGKSTFYSWLAPLFGNYYENIRTSDLGSHFIGTEFNEKFLIAIDEWNVRELDRRTADGLLKNIITDPSMRVEAKFVQASTTTSHNNLIASTNFAFNITPSSAGYFRRLLLINCGSTQTPHYYKNIHKIIGNMHDNRHRFTLSMHLWAKFLYERDISRFRPSKFPITAFQLRVITNAWKSAQKWWYEVMQRGYVVGTLRFQNFVSMMTTHLRGAANTGGRFVNLSMILVQFFENMEQYKRPSQFPRIHGIAKHVIYDQFTEDMRDLYNVDVRKTAYSSTQFFHELFAVIPYHSYSDDGKDNMVIFPPREFCIRYMYSQNYAQGFDLRANPFRLDLGPNKEYASVLEELHNEISADPESAAAIEDGIEDVSYRGGDGIEDVL